jgi:hypothetical protein
MILRLRGGSKRQTVYKRAIAREQDLLRQDSLPKESTQKQVLFCDPHVLAVNKVRLFCGPHVLAVNKVRHS